MDDSTRVLVSHVSLTAGNPHLAGYPHFIAYSFLFRARAIHQASGVASRGFDVAIASTAYRECTSALRLMFRQRHWPRRHHPLALNFYFAPLDSLHILQLFPLGLHTHWRKCDILCL